MITKTITFHADYNYGAVLQSYSLQRYLIENGIDNELIDIRHQNAIGVAGFFDHRCNVKVAAKNCCKLFFFPKLFSYRKKMRSFLKNELRLTKRYKTYKEIAEDIPAADCLICGSDQIWNISNTIRKEFFLDFPTASKKISYAPSFGGIYLDDYQEKYVKYALSGFSTVSVRENSGVGLLHGMGIKNAVQCVDPVFLHSKEYWEELCKNSTAVTPDEKYILVYSLHYDPALQRSVRAIREKYGYAVYSIATGGFTRIEGSKKIINASPFEFLNLIMNAEYVVASSFHGLAFSIIFEKNFYAYANAHSGARVIDMLGLVGLEDRRIGTDSDDVAVDYIDYSDARVMLEEAVARSKKYLTEAINE